MRLDIRYTTQFSYAEPVRESQNELRASPTVDARQHLVAYRVETTPSARVLSWNDWWGTRVDAFGVREPHNRLLVVAEATVETRDLQPLHDAPPWRALADPDFADQHLDLLQPSRHVHWTNALAGESRQHVEAVSSDVLSSALALQRLVGDRLNYVSGSTYVGVPIAEVLESGQGVCQDFAHVLIACCRSVGIPARYVSGYLFTQDDATGADDGNDTVNVQTHAWAEIALPGVGWWPLDPTNRQPVGERHVKIGHGRDYDDVAPLRGVFSGPSAHDLTVDVQLRRLATGQQ